jgi:hypothetical protein
MLEQYITVMRNPEEFELVGNAIRDMTFQDPAFDMIRRHGKKPKATAESMILTARGVAKALHIPPAQNEAIENGVKHQYHALFSQLYSI